MPEGLDEAGQSVASVAGLLLDRGGLVDDRCNDDRCDGEHGADQDVAADAEFRRAAQFRDPDRGLWGRRHERPIHNAAGSADREQSHRRQHRHEQRTALVADGIADHDLGAAGSSASDHRRDDGSEHRTHDRHKDKRRRHARAEATGARAAGHLHSARGDVVQAINALRRRQHPRRPRCRRWRRRQRRHR